MPYRPRHPFGFARKRTYKTGAIRWQGIVQYPDRSKRSGWGQESKMFDLKADADAWALARAEEIKKAGGYEPPKKQTVSEWLEHWMRTYVHVNLEPSTEETYSWLIRKHIMPPLGDLRLSALTPQILQSWVADLSEKETPRGTPLSTRTVAAVYGVLRDALGEAVRSQALTANPLDRVRLPKQKRKVVHSFTLAQIRELDQVCETRRLGAPFTFLWQTGLRISEAIAMRWEDVDLDEATIFVHRKIVVLARGRNIEGPPKTDAGIRHLALMPETVDLLRRHRARQKEEAVAHEAEPDWNATGLVFPSTRGTPLSRRNISRAWAVVRDRAGLPRYGLHALRHTHATLEAQAGVGMREIAATLGREDPGFTSRTYVHVLEEMKRNAATKLHNLIEKPGER